MTRQINKVMQRCDLMMPAQGSVVETHGWEQGRAVVLATLKQSQAIAKAESYNPFVV